MKLCQTRTGSRTVAHETAEENTTEVKNIFKKSPKIKRIKTKRKGKTRVQKTLCIGSKQEI